MNKFALLVLFFMVGYFAAQVDTTEPSPKYLALVKDTIYHCEEIKKTPCGLYLSCGKDAFYCATNVTIEKIL